MQIEHILILAVCGLGVIHGFSLGTYLLIKNGHVSKSNRILGILILLFALRISKSIFLYFTPNLDFTLITLGLTLILSFGPLFYFYVRTYLDETFVLKKGALFHFIPFLLFFILNSFILLSKDFYLSFGIYFIYLHFFGYILYSFYFQRKFLKQQPHFPIDQKRWIFMIHIGVIFIWVSYFIFLFGEQVPYILGPLTYAVAIYGLSFWAISHKVLQKEIKYQNSSLDSNKSVEISDELSLLFEKEKIFLNPDLKLSQVAKILKVTPHSLSQAVNENHKLNFQQYLNFHRIQEAKELLTSDKKKQLTIASIAFDVGFNSISAFNAAFKKQEGTTPSHFRK